MNVAGLTAACAALILLSGLQGCAGVAISSSTYAVKASGRQALQQRAEAGDVEAAYELGRSWCCMGPGFDTQTATHWLCRAAAHGHAGALFELGRIYQGEVSRTPAPGQKLMRLLTADKSLAHALAFHTLAGQAGHAEAAVRAGALAAEADQASRARARALSEDFESQCEYDAVFVAHAG